MGLKLGAAVYTYLYECSLEDAIARLADMGFRAVELVSVPPFPTPADMDKAARRRLVQRCSSLGIKPETTQPTYTDLNISSLNDGIRKESVRQLQECLELASDLEIPYVVTVTGRVNALIQPPLDKTLAMATESIESLLPMAEKLGVTLALESTPVCPTPDSESLLRLVARLNHPNVKVTIDTANAQMVESPAEAYVAARRHLAVVHLSDTLRSRWLHAIVGDGEVDFGAVAQALKAIDYRGISILEVVVPDGRDEAFRRSKAILERLGWEV